jgi:hypothetical protein
VLVLLVPFASAGVVRTDYSACQFPMGYPGTDLLGYPVPWAVQYARLDAAMLWASVTGLVGVMLLAGVGGRLRERRRMTRSRP